MGPRQTTRREQRSAWVVILLLPALVFGGLSAWFHDHGPSGRHLHLGSHDAAHVDPDALQAWHAAQHGHEHEDPSDEQPAPRGLRVEFPQVLMRTSEGPVPAGTAVQIAANRPAPAWHLELAEIPHRFEPCRSSWPPHGPRRPGITALLSSSHAILI